MKMEATLGNPVLIFIYTFSVLLLGCAIGAHWHFSGAALGLVVAAAVLMAIHDLATGILWCWITAKWMRTVYKNNKTA